MKIVMEPVARRISYLAVILLGLAWAVLSRPSVGTAGAATSGQIPSPQVGFLAPSFTLRDLAGQTVNLSDYQGQKKR